MLLTSEQLDELRHYVRPYRRTSATLMARRDETWKAAPDDPRGPLRAGAGYWVVSDGTEEWPVSDPVYRYSYLEMEQDRGDGPRRVERITWTSMVQINRDFAVRTPEAETPQRGRKDDFLAFGIAGEHWVVRQELVGPGRAYESLWPESDDPDLRVFISYRRADADRRPENKEAIDRLERRLERKREGGVKCRAFRDVSDLGDGRWRSRIREEIANAHVVLVLLGEHWIESSGDDDPGVAITYEFPLAILNQWTGGTVYPALFDVKEDRVRGVRVSVFGREELLSEINMFTTRLVDRLADRWEYNGEAITELASRVLDFAERAAATRATRRLPDWDSIFPPDTPLVEPIDSAGADPGVPMPLRVDRPALPSTYTPHAAVDGPWVAFDSGTDPVLVTLDGDRLDIPGRRVEPFEEDLTGVVASDDGRALAVTCGGDLYVIESGVARPWRPIALPVPGLRPLAMMRRGRTYVVQLGDDTQRVELTIDSGGGVREKRSRGGATCSAVAGGDFVDIVNGRARRSQGIPAIGTARLRSLVWIDACKFGDPADPAWWSGGWTGSRSRRRDVVAALGKDAAEQTILVVQDGDAKHAMPVDPSASRVAVVRPSGPDSVPAVLVQTADGVSGWRVADLPQLQ